MRIPRSPFRGGMGRCAVDGTDGCLRKSHVYVRITSTMFCDDGGLYVRVTGIRGFDGAKIINNNLLTSYSIEGVAVPCFFYIVQSV